MNNQEAIEILKNERPGCGEKIPYTEEEKCEAYDIAISAIERQTSKKVKIKEWSPAVCPSCGYELSESIGDGYYKHHTLLEICPKCYQRLEWSDSD